MANTIRSILEQSGDRQMKELPVMMKALKMANVVTPIKGNQTAKETLIRLSQNDPDILDKTIPSILRPNNTSYDCKTIMMWVMLIVISTGFAITNIYIALKNNIIISWEDMALTLIGPLLVVLYDRGIISRENREVLALLAGNNPAMTMMESITQRIANGPKSNRRYKKDSNDVDY